MYTPLESTIRAAYLEYANDFITVERFAEHHMLSITDAHEIIKMGRKLHELEVEAYRAVKGN